MRPFLVLLCLALLVLRAPSAQAQDFAATFPPSALRAQLPGVERVLVVAAGKNTSESEPAASAIEAAFRAAGCELVMSDDALGDVSAKDDQAVVAAAQPLPAEAVAVVRVFGAELPTPPSVVVVVYDKQGGVLGAFNGRAGEPIAGPTGSQGAEVRAIEAVTSITQSTPQSSSAAQRVYDEHYIWFADRALVNANSGQVLRTWSEPVRGKYRERIRWDRFYEAVGRDDLAREFHHNRKVRHRRIGWSIPLLAVGAGLGVFGLFDAIVGTETDECEDTGYLGNCISSKRERHYGALAVSVPFIAGGTTLLVLGVTKRVQPLKPSEAQRLADEHNRKLRAKLGLPAEAETAADDSAPRPRHGVERTLALTPSFSRTAGGLSLKLTF